jgi:uncharacterized RDD family membrane protein YckC
MFYDGLLLVAVLAVTFLLPLTILGVVTGALPVGGLLWLYVFVVLGAYFLWHWHRGQTLAMRTWGLALRSANGGMPSLRQSTVRYLLAWPSLACCGAGIVWAVFDPDRQFLHDRLAGTRVVFAA